MADMPGNSWSLSIALRAASNRLIASKRYEIAPRQTRPFTRKDSVVFLVELRESLVALCEQAQEKQIGNLLDGVHGVVHPTGVENIHELVNFLSQTR